MSPERMKATGRVNRPMMSRAPPISSMHAGRPTSENGWTLAKAGNGRKAEDLGHAVLEEHQPGDDAQTGSSARGAHAASASVHDVSPVCVNVHNWYRAARLSESDAAT